MKRPSKIMTNKKYSREELLTAVEEAINQSEDFEDGFRAGMEHGALSVLEQLTDEEWGIWEINLSSDVEWSDEERQEFIDSIDIDSTRD